MLGRALTDLGEWDRAKGLLEQAINEGTHAGSA